MIRKISALLAVLLLCLCCTVSCGQEDPNTPEDMQSATMAGEPFRLYVPDSWTPNLSSGISGAYYSSADKILVTARYYTPADPSMTLDQYVDACAADYAATLKDFSITAREAALLGGENAVKLSYKMTDTAVEMTCFQVTAAYGGDFVSLNAYCASSIYESVSADYDAMVREFVLCEKSDPNGEKVTDKDTPEGFEIASADHIEYRLYVPEIWVCDAESGKSEAYYPESGKSNVSVTSFAPDESISVSDYFKQCEVSYKASLPGYTFVSETTRTVAERPAYSYTYLATVDGVEFSIMQTMFAYNEMIYSFTYTALSENFSLHMADVEAMLNAFTFR